MTLVGAGGLPLCTSQGPRTHMYVHRRKVTLPKRAHGEKSGSHPRPAPVPVPRGCR